MVTVTFGTDAPDGSVTMPAKAAVPADCAIKVEADTAKSINSEAIASHALSGFLNFMVPYSPCSISRPALRGRGWATGFPGAHFLTKMFSTLLSDPWRQTGV